MFICSVFLINLPGSHTRSRRKVTQVTDATVSTDQEPMTSARVLEIVIAAVANVWDEDPAALGMRTVLIGQDGTHDSMTVTSILVELEQVFGELGYKAEVMIEDIKGVTTIQQLVGYIVALLGL